MTLYNYTDLIALTITIIMYDEYETTWKEIVAVYFEVYYCPSNYLEGLRKITKDLN